MSKKQKLQQESAHSWQAPSQRPQRPQRPLRAADTSIRWSLILAIVIIGLLLVSGMVLGLLSIVDALRGHPGMSWHHLTAWIDSIKVWLITGVLLFIAVRVAPHIIEIQASTAEQRGIGALRRAEAKRVREQARRERDIRLHNREAMPQIYIALPDEQGNYGQAFTGGYLLPGNTQSGNAGLNKQLLDILAQQNAVDADEELLQIEGPESIDPRTVEAPTLEEDVQSGRVTPGESVTMGYRLIMDEFTGIWSVEPIIDPDDASMFVCAASTAGKSTLVASMMARMAARGDTVFVVIDPHKNNPDRSIMAKVMPALEPWLAYPVAFGKDAKELAGAVKFLKELIALRQGSNTAAKQRHPLHGLKVRVIIDEALAMAAITRREKHDKAYDELLQVMQEMAIETAKDEIMYIAMAQLATKAQMGDIDIRDVCPKTIILKTPKQSGLALNLTGEQATLAHFFKRGRGFYIGDADEPEIFIWGNASAAGIAQVAAMSRSPLVKTDSENRSPYLYSLPMTVSEESGFEALESGWNTDRGNRFPSALQANLDTIENWHGKLDRLRPVFGGELADVIYAVWEVRPGRGDRYKEARAEYDVLKLALQWQLEQSPEREA